MLLLHFRQIFNLRQNLLQKETSPCIFVSYGRSLLRMCANQYRYQECPDMCKMTIIPPTPLPPLPPLDEISRTSTHTYHVHPVMDFYWLFLKQKVFLTTSNNLNIIPQEVLQKAVFTKAGRRALSCKLNIQQWKGWLLHFS